LIVEGKTHKGELAESLGLSRASLYYPPKQPKKDEVVKIKIEEALRYHPSYGHKRLAKHLGMGKNRVRRVMKLFCIKPYRRRGKKWLKQKADGADYPNLIKHIVPLYPGHIWASDFTYLWFIGAWLYVATIIDLYTRKIVGLSIGRSHDRWLVQTALFDALRYNGRPHILHSDHGSEYKSKVYQGTVYEMGIIPSMAAKGSPWENGYQESFYSQFKVELGDPGRFKSLGELTAAIYKQIHYYDNRRLHTSLNMAPEAFARQYDTLNQAVQSVS
jgi:putative transposase